MPSLNSRHPGRYVRNRVIPTGMSVTNAARMIGVGRPALSNLLNGKAGLSRQMAARLERAFGADASDLMRRQAAYEVARSDKRYIASVTGKHVPPFLMATANDIQDWSETHEARDLLAVLLRTLVNSTCDGIRFVDFPGRDDSQRRGWDGRVETDNGNQWVPDGVSAWEFGTNQRIASKANADYTVRTRATAEGERRETTFVFVTPRRWNGKDRWAKEKAAEGQWRHVRALDASDFEQWMDQSVPAQAWFAGCRGINLEGVKSLDRCWIEWCADCEPKFSEEIFAQAISAHREKILSHLGSKNGRLLSIVADSSQEGLAFLSALFSHGDHCLREFRDRVVVFNEPGPLTKLAVGAPGFIPVVTSTMVEKELAQSGCGLTGLVVEHRTAAVRESALKLEPLTYRAFTEGLASMGLGSEEIERYDRECGRSLTVLRRRLARSEAIRSPDWSANEQLASRLAPLALAGAWVGEKAADRYLMVELTGAKNYESLERNFNRLLNLEGSPVWCVGGFRGVVSKIDALFGVRQWVTEDQIDRFMEVADFVLSERDPALDLARKDQWAATMYGKEREVSAALRNGIAESLVLLSIHGNRLFGNRFQQSSKSKVSGLVHTLLYPLCADRLLSQSSRLPLYAEAAPRVFLEVFERDLSLEKPVVAVLMHPIGDALFQPSDRVDLLWALELLAWRSDWLHRVVELLARLASLEPDDNLANKPSESLQSIFRSWMPQTAASVEQRKEVFDALVTRHPSVAWRIAIAQFDPLLASGGYSHKPRWRDYALGTGEPVTESEHGEFVIHCIEICLGWRQHTCETLADLLKRGERLDPQHLERLERTVARWAKSAGDPDRAWLRERLRVSVRRRIRHRSRSSDMDAGADEIALMAGRVCAVLEPADLVWKNAWLFENRWVRESWDDLHDDMNLEAHEKRVRTKRLKAVRQVADGAGHAGILRLAFSGKAAYSVGSSMAEVANDEQELLGLILAIIENGDILTSAAHRSLISGILQSVGEASAVSFVCSLWEECGANVGIQLLCLCRFNRSIWSILDGRSEEVGNRYWSSVQPTWRCDSIDDINFAVSQLLKAGRPMAALDYADSDWRKVESELIRSVLTKLPSSDEFTNPETRLDANAIRRALKVLNERRVFSQTELARLEFQYLDMFWLDREELPNLEREIEDNPALFCEAVALAYRRESGGAREDLSEVELQVGRRAYRLLHKLERIPGHGMDGTLTTDRLTGWIRTAQDICRRNGRQRSGDQQIGRLLANAPAGSDGIWPCEAVRETLEELLNEDISVGFELGRRNQRGAHWRGDGGAQERELAAQYRGWAKACEYSYPNVAATLRRIESAYKSEARWHDQESAVQKRLGY